MKRITTVICMALLWILTVQAQIQELNVSKRFNWGIRLGVNAPLVDIRHLTLNGNKVNESDSESRLGLSGSFIGRYNFKRNYIQLEVGMHQFHTRLYNPDYELRLFAGPRVSYIFNETSGISTTGGSFRNLIYDESPNSFSFYLIGGLSTTIGHLYIDFRYAYCVGNSKDLSFKVNPDELQTSQVKLSRAVNELSISIGYLW